MADDTSIERRIQERAFQIWIDEGRPDGRANAHWELAKLAISQQDALRTMLKPPELPGPEPIEAIANQAEMPTLTDQDEQQIPARPSRKRTGRGQVPTRRLIIIVPRSGYYASA